ncbi:MAG: GNAT family N-acetyltransferase [Actinobacteria bacterium]|nr:GNAT family N-acetyltransferase [Actinomycetota bacterium]
MFESPVEAKDLILTRVHRPDHDLLVTLEAYDFEAFGFTGLRTYDLAVTAQAGAVYLAYLNDEMVGSCQLLRMLDEPDFFYVVGFYVRPEWQHRHVGRALLAAVATEVRKLGGQGMLLTVAPNNTRALDLYRRAGFVEESFIPHFYGEQEDRHVLRWRFEQEGLHGSV